MTDDLMECGNCGLVRPYAELPPAKDLHARLEPGDIYTDVECPACGCLCAPVAGATKSRRDNSVPMILNPPTEAYYAWYELVTLDGETTPRLLVPWGDPQQYEYPADGMFDTSQEAKEWKREYAPAENWFLVRKTLEPVEFVPGEDDPDA